MNGARDTESVKNFSSCHFEQSQKSKGPIEGFMPMCPRCSREGDPH